MRTTRLAALLAAASLASLGAATAARADFSYTTAISITDVQVSGVSVGSFTNTAGGAIATFGGTTVTMTNEGRAGFTVPSVNTINIGDVGVVTTTVPPSADTFSILYTDIFTLVNTAPPGSNATGSFTLHGRLDLVGINTGSGTVDNTYFSPSSASGILGGIFFAGAADNFGNLTINGASGNLGGTLDASAVPEPASLTLLGVGALGAWRLAKQTRRRTEARDEEVI